MRCKKCRTYINPYVQWEYNGRRWKCNLCGFTNETTNLYYSWFSLLVIVLACRLGFFHVRTVLRPWTTSPTCIQRTFELQYFLYPPAPNKLFVQQLLRPGRRARAPRRPPRASRALQGRCRARDARGGRRVTSLKTLEHSSVVGLVCFGFPVVCLLFPSCFRLQICFFRLVVVLVSVGIFFVVPLFRLQEVSAQP